MPISTRNSRSRSAKNPVIIVEPEPDPDPSMVLGDVYPDGPIPRFPGPSVSHVVFFSANTEGVSSKPRGRYIARVVVIAR